MGIAGKVTPGGVEWTGDLHDLYAANLHLRTASRVLVRVARFRARSFIEMERHVRRIDWAPFNPVDSGGSIGLHVSSRKSRLYHERAIAERFERMIGDQLGAPVAALPVGDDEKDADAEEGDQLFVVRFVRDECTVSADTSGELLHRRGYRRAVAKAPLRENLAAAMLIAAGWTSGAPLIDPFCGSGTIPIEGALLARRIPPGLASVDRIPRRYAFERWPGFRADLWGDIVAAAVEEILEEVNVQIVGADRDAGAIEAAMSNAERAGVGADLTFLVRPISASERLTGENGWLLTNPPYGHRLGEAMPLRDLYATLGRMARERLAGWTIGLLAADDGLARHTGLAFQSVLATRNGGIPVRLLLHRGVRSRTEGSGVV